MSGLAYHPSEHVAATTGADGVLSIWRQDTVSKRPDKAPAAWRCSSTASYKGVNSTACPSPVPPDALGIFSRVLHQVLLIEF